MPLWPAALNGNIREERPSERHETAYEKLRSTLIRYEFKPGERLIIAELALQIGVSPTPVREALGRLREEMLIEFIPGRGYFCPVPDLRVLTDLHKALAHLLIFTFDDVLVQPAGKGAGGIAGTFHSHGDEVSGRSRATARAQYVEDILAQFVALSGNQIFSLWLDNIIARTHIIRCLMFESAEQFQAAETCLNEIQTAVDCCDRKTAKEIVLSSSEKQIDMLPTLLKELFARRYIESQNPLAS